eukprot:gb/GECG01005829.1/.p1 GENE.gb/GECG01005829.1/~~gb/GECG01005829.1/.p1  ORF type:complete len:595 (+),score=102.68 gb/GECG01005829.1/:1-1785(+)
MSEVHENSMPEHGKEEPATVGTTGAENEATEVRGTQSGRRGGVDMSKYRKVQENKDTAAEDEVRITNKSKIEAYVSYALSLFEEKNFEKVTLKAMGRCIYKAVTTAEVCKRRLSGLHQVTDIISEKVVDRFEPIDPESGLEPIEKERYIPCMTIVLATKEDAVDTSAKGYQQPLPDAEVVPRDQHVCIDTRVVDNPGNMNGGGRGGGRGGPNSRNWRKGAPGRNRGGGGRNRGGGVGRGNMNQNQQQAPQMQMPGMNMMSPYQMMMPNMPNMAAPNGQWMMMPPMQAQPYDAATLEAMQNAGIVPSLPVQQGQQYQQQYDQDGQPVRQNNNRRQQGRNNRGGRRNEGEQRGGTRDRRGGRRGGGANRDGDKGRRGNTNNKQGANKPNQRKQRAPSASAFPPMTVIQSSNPSAAAAKYQQEEAHSHATASENGGMAVGATSSVEGVAITSEMGMAPPEAAMGERGPWQQVLLRGSSATSSSEPGSMQQSSHPPAPTSGSAQHAQGGHHQPPPPSHVPADSGTAPHHHQPANMAPQKPAYNAPVDHVHPNHVQENSAAPVGYSNSTDGHDGQAHSAGNSSSAAGGKTSWARILGGR